MAVRTAVLAKLHVTDVLSHTLFTVPTTQTWIIKSIIIGNPGGVAISPVAQLLSADGLVSPPVFSPTVNPGFDAEYTGQPVVGPGDKLIVFSSGQPYDVWVSGAKLAGVAT